MIDSSRLTIDVPRAYLERLEAVARRTGRDTSSLVAEALGPYLDSIEWYLKAVQEAIDEADSGAKPIEHAVVSAWIESLGTENELPRPR